jgi:hypothetical protein
MIVSVGVRVCERKIELGAINPRLSTFRPGRPALKYADPLLLRCLRGLFGRIGRHAAARMISRG